MNDPLQLFQIVSQIGFPALFIIGQLREWWYIKPHVELLADRLRESSTLVVRMQQQVDDATEVADAAHHIARQSLELAHANDRVLNEIHQLIKTLHLEVTLLRRHDYHKD